MSVDTGRDASSDDPVGSPDDAVDDAAVVAAAQAGAVASLGGAPAGVGIRRQLDDRIIEILLYVGSVLLALSLSAVLVVGVGGSPGAVFSALLDGSIRSPGAWGLTITTMAPLLLIASGTIVATRAGLVNIGQEGQVLIGAAFAAYVATRLPGPGPIVIASALLFAAVGGGIWAGIAAALRGWRKVPEVLTTLLLTFIAFSLITYAIRQPWLIGDRDTSRPGRVNTGEQIPANVRLPDLVIFGNAIDSGAFIAIGVAIALAWMMARSNLGARIDMVGLNRRAAQRFGVAERPLSAMLLIGSGSLAAIGGAVMLHGGATGDRMTIGFSGNFGWEGLLVALLARNRVLLAIPMALVFAMLRTGSSFLAATGVDRKVTDVVQALLVLALLLPPALMFIRDRRRALAASTGGAG